MVKIVALAGSLRKESFNQKLVKVAAKGAEDAGAEVRIVTLSDYDIPLFFEDLEAKGTPQAVNELKRLFADSDGMLIANPEYNGSISGVLKNTIDWLSRPTVGDDIGSAFRGKVAGIMATSPGALGGLRGLNHTRDVLYNLGVLVYPGQVAVPGANTKFDDDGHLSDEGFYQRVHELGVHVVEIAESLH